jgi:fucose 4-O-acetylase-like acetyltransferase
VVCWLTAAPGISSSRNRAIVGALASAAIVALASPLLWTTLRPNWLPWPLESYINGVHTFNQPQPWLFPLFPWSAFAFAGLAVGFFLFSDIAKRRQALVFASIGAIGVFVSALSSVFDKSPVHLYSSEIYDYWHTSPNFFLMRCGILLVILFLAYTWCRWGLAQKGFSPIIQLGQTSLLVYWVHIEFVYGRFSILPKGQCTIPKATAGLLVVFLAMLALSIWRTRWKKRAATVLPANPAVAATAESG